MQLDLGHKIRELRRRDGRTQEALAEALGVTSQAVSRWESNGGYPDMEMIPAIANFFHVSIDELFGYHDNREERIKKILAQARQQIQNQGNVLGKDIGDYEGCVQLLREASEEFPNEPEILYLLGSALYRLGWQKYGGRLCRKTGDTEYLQDHVEYNSQNVYWKETLQVWERLLKLDISSDLRGTTAYMATMLYGDMGEYEKAKMLANGQDSIYYCKEMLLPLSTVGEEVDQFRGESIIACLRGTERVLEDAVNFRMDIQTTEYSRSVLLAATELYEMIFNDGRCGREHDRIKHLYMTLARLEARHGDLPKAEEYFDKGFAHAKSYVNICTQGDYRYSAPLVDKVTVPADDFLKVTDGYLKEYIQTLPENLVARLQKNPKYAECFA